MRVKTVCLDPWKWEGAIFDGGTPAEMKAVARREYDADIDIGEHSMGHCYVEYGKPWMLWVLSVLDAPSLAHEALHTVSGVLEGRGLKWTPESEEAFTYTMEFLMRAALDPDGWTEVETPQ